MAGILADHFLKDLDDLSEEDEELQPIAEKQREEAKGEPENSDDEPIVDAIEEYYDKLTREK